MSQETEQDTEQGAKQVATLKIWRGSARDTPQWQSYEVPFEPGQSVLDGLRWLRIHKDPSLAVRFSCINANACKECMIQLDGDTVYACTARLEPRAMPGNGKTTRSRSSPANRCSTACAGCAFIRTRHWRCATPASTPMPARNA